jgi:predicted nucleic acid-binding protein
MGTPISPYDLQIAAIAYVQNQKIHHQQGTAIAMLEKIDHNDDPPQLYKLSP